jgi:hypothetical protein
MAEIVGKVYIGIDTGTHTGVAIWDGERFLSLDTMAIHKAMQIVNEYVQSGSDVVVRVEDPRQRTWFGTERMSREQERKKLQGVGSVKRDASIWEDFLSDLCEDEANVKYEMVAPKRNVTKLTSESFKAITRWQGRTNEHCRDAAMLVYGL